MSNKYSFFDDLRSLVALHQSGEYNTTDKHESLKLESVKTKQGSHVTEVTTIENEHETKTYRLLTLPVFVPLSWGGRSIPELHAQAKVVLMAVKDFNFGINSVISKLPTPTSFQHSTFSSKDDAVCDIRFVADFYDTEFSPLAASRLLIEELSRRETPFKPTAVIGGYRSQTSMQMEVLNSIFDVPQISHRSSSTDLDNKRLFGRILASNSGISFASVDFLLHLTKGKIQDFALLYVENDYGRDLRKSISYYATYQHQIKVKAFSMSTRISRGGQFHVDQNVIVDAIKRIADSGFRYIVCSITPNLLIQVMKEAVHQKIVGPEYFWVFGEMISVDTFQSLSFDPESERDLALAFQGIAHVLPDYSGSEEFQRFLKEWSDSQMDDEFGKFFQYKQPRHSESVKFLSNHTFPEVPPSIAPSLYDIVMALGMAACSIKDRFFDGVSLFDAVKAIKFDGMTGRVGMNNQTGTRDYKTVLYKVSNIIIHQNDNDKNKSSSNITLDCNQAFESSHLVMTDDGDGGASSSFKRRETLQWVEVGEGFRFSDFSLNVPDPLPPVEEEDLNLLGAPLKFFVLSLCFLVLLSSIFFASWTCHLRRSRVVQASQPIFLIMICIGTFIMGLSFIPLSFEDSSMSQEAMDFSCMAVWWTYSFGYVLTMTALFSKTWRINKIMNQKAFRRIQVGVRDVILPGTIILSANLTILVVWANLSPAKYERSHKYSSSFDRYGRPEQSIGLCVSEKGNISYTFYVFLLFILNGAVTLVAAYQAWRARKISTEFAESHYIGIAVIIFLQALLIGGPIIIFSPPGSSPKGIFIAKALIFFFSSAIVLFLIFLPKLIFHRKIKMRKRQLRLEKTRRLLNNHSRKHLNYHVLQNEKKKVSMNICAHSQDHNHECVGNMKSNSSGASTINTPSTNSTSEDGSEEKGLGICFQSEKEEQKMLSGQLSDTQTINKQLREESVVLKSKLLEVYEASSSTDEEVETKPVFSLASFSW